jgi:hypothetical protein
MLNRKLRGLVVVMTVAAAALSLSQPALAGEISRSGTIGHYKVVDTKTDQSVLAHYRWYNGDNLGWLKKFVVDPPRMKAVAGRSDQTVGWQFYVERKDCGFTSCSRWKKTYTSPEMTAVTDDSHNAAFMPASVRVYVPCGHLCEDLVSAYRVTIKMIWHKPNGNVQGTARYRIVWYESETSRGDHGRQKNVAGAAWSPDF